MAIVIAYFSFAAPTPAFAHSVDKRFGDFYGGMFHPLTALEHLCPIIGLSLLAGQQGPTRARCMLLVFPAGLLVGAIVGNLVGPNDFISWVNKLSFVVLGISVAAAIRLPFLVLMAISLFFGITHGYENAAGVSATVAMHMFLPGVVISGLTLVAIVAAVVVSLNLPWQKIAVRVVGSWIAAIGLLIIGLA